MATLATEVRWTSKTPKICFDFSYEKKRTGAAQCYQVTVSCRTLYTDTAKFGYPIYVQIYLDGTQKTSFTLKAASPSSWSSAIQSTTGWLEVANKTSGTTALKIRIYSGSGSSRDQSYEYTLPIDPAASTISSTPATIGYDSIVTVRQYNNAFTHTIAYSVGNETGYIDASGNFVSSSAKISATSISVNIPERFYDHIPDNKEGTINLTCSTYSGSTLIGENQGNMKFRVDEEHCAPAVSGTAVDVNPVTLAVTGDENVFVCFKSTALCEITAEAKCGASINSKTINNVSVGDLTRIIEQVETGRFVFAVNDSRGILRDAEVGKTLIPYVRLTNNASIKRTDPTSGNVQLTLKGNCFKGSFGAVDNKLTVTCEISGKTLAVLTPEITEDDKYEMVAVIPGLDYMKKHTVTVTVADQLDSVSVDLTVQPGIPIFDWGEKDFQFHVPVDFDQSVSGVYIRTVRLAGTKTIAVQGRFSAFDPSTSSRQSVFLFGWDNSLLVSGVAGLCSNGTASWNGTEGVSITDGENGQFVISLEVAAYDYFTLISAEPISIIT